MHFSAADKFSTENGRLIVDAIFNADSYEKVIYKSSALQRVRDEIIEYL